MPRVDLIDMYLATMVGTFMAVMALLEHSVAKDAADNGHTEFAETYFKYMPGVCVIPCLCWP